jgi:hypothetical protein
MSTFFAFAKRQPRASGQTSKHLCYASSMMSVISFIAKVSRVARKKKRGEAPTNGSVIKFRVEYSNRRLITTKEFDQDPHTWVKALRMLCEVRNCRASLVIIAIQNSKLICMSRRVRDCILLTI